MSVAIEVNNLSKRFFRNPDEHSGQSILDLFREIVGYRKSVELRDDEFYAVRGLSFRLNYGETLALVGRNGCGKTTALKMITGLIKPDFGSVKASGNIQALIALGAGFDQRLSGRENIINSAAMLGLKANDIRLLEKKIIEFSELERFIDSPVNTYSSGMYARLGFSVAVHLDPRILIIDEILGVGDFAFQNKCFLRMQELKANGTTIVLVSHSHAKVVQMCERAIWLDNGNVVMDGKSKEVVDKYVKSLEIEAVQNQSDPSSSVGKGVSDIYGPIHKTTGYVSDVKVDIKDSRCCDVFDGIEVHDDLVVDYEFKILKEVGDLNVSINIVTLDGRLINTISTLNGDLLKNKKSGFVKCRITINDLNLVPGTYVVTMPIHDGHSYLFRDVVGRFLVKSGDRMTWGVVDFNYNYEVR